jgi:hypothetical protein
MGWLRDRFDDQISIGITAKLPAAVDKWDSIVEYIREKYYNGCCASKLILMDDLIQTYRRVIRASEQGNGVRLSPEESSTWPTSTMLFVRPWPLRMNTNAKQSDTKTYDRKTAARGRYHRRAPGVRPAIQPVPRFSQRLGNSRWIR